jgi:hypothetical protein
MAIIDMASMSQLTVSLVPSLSPFVSALTQTSTTRIIGTMACANISVSSFRMVKSELIAEAGNKRQMSLLILGTDKTSQFFGNRNFSINSSRF